PGRAALPRRQGAPDLRRHGRDPDLGDRAGSALALGERPETPCRVSLSDLEGLMAPEEPAPPASAPTSRDGIDALDPRDPERIVLGVRPGPARCAKPPVRIFLGSEASQFRPERVLVWSIERVRDPARVYEIHLMKEIAGFDRRGWTTGFTNYRFAIPEWAGGEGRAIYDDEDQIYLSDPARLFDAEMGEHGFLAIAERESSVMLLDCARMLPLWNLAAARRGSKKALLRRAALTPGLFGRCDAQWNARDGEYREGRSHLLHYTTLHTQPWRPFPGRFVYQDHPQAELWLELERSADAAGFQLFGRARPSAAFRAVAATGARRGAGAA